jgi:hypothetical protein
MDMLVVLDSNSRKGIPDDRKNMNPEKAIAPAVRDLYIYFRSKMQRELFVTKYNGNNLIGGLYYGA